MPRVCRDLFRAILVFSLATCEAPGQEWPRFRGPNGTGVSDARTIPASWTDGDYRWRVELPGIGYSSPVVAGSRLFITSGLEDDATQVVTCLSIADGAVLCANIVGSAPDPFNCYAASTQRLTRLGVFPVGRAGGSPWSSWTSRPGRNGGGETSARFWPNTRSAHRRSCSRSQ